MVGDRDGGWVGGLEGWGEMAVGWGRAGGKVGFNGLNVQVLFECHAL